MITTEKEHRFLGTNSQMMKKDLLKNKDNSHSENAQYERFLTATTDKSVSNRYIIPRLLLSPTILALVLICGCGQIGVELLPIGPDTSPLYNGEITETDVSETDTDRLQPDTTFDTGLATDTYSDTDIDIDSDSDSDSDTDADSGTDSDTVSDVDNIVVDVTPIPCI